MLYRIVTDKYAGYEVQFKWAALLWLEAGRHNLIGINTHSSQAAAERFIEDHYHKHLKKPAKFKSKEVKRISIV